MISLNRSKTHRWILQKNISNPKLFGEFLSSISENKNVLDNEVMLKNNKMKSYKGRSASGCANTMGVRLSQVCFYMFGYKSNHTFFPSPTTTLAMSNPYDDNCELFLVNLFSLQYPHPFSKTDDEFQIYAGRLLITLLLEPRINKRLYIDEIIWFLPFLEKITPKIYEELIISIKEYRKLSYGEKKILFESIPDYDAIFANCVHEFKYYFISLFSGLGVLRVVPDAKHNGGHLFYFNHGKSQTKRSDAYESNKKISGYIMLNNKIESQAQILCDNFSCFDKPISENDYLLTKMDWIKNLYEFEQLEYINLIYGQENQIKHNIEILKKMVFNSKYGSKDGKDFEKSLEDTFNLFREIKDTELISGPGDTDLVCHMKNDVSGTIFKFNVDAKSTGKSTQSLNAARLNRHIEKNGSKYCIVVAPKFSKGANKDIIHEKIVSLNAESLAEYCLNDCLTSNDGLANFTEIDNCIESHLGTNISVAIDNLTNKKFGIKIIR